MTTLTRNPLKIAVAGLGGAGAAIARRLLGDQIPGAKLVAVSSRRAEDVEARLFAGLDPTRRAATVPSVDLVALASLADVVVEALPPHLFRSAAEPALAAGRTLIPLSVGALVVGNPDLFGLADRTGAEIVIPSGAIGALDLLRTAAEGGITRVRLVSRKPPNSLAGLYGRLATGELTVDVKKAIRVFAGSARTAVEAYPANANVAAALAIAGIGVERTEVEIWADPTVSRNVHRVEVEANSANFVLEVEGLPSASNPRTSQIAGDSVVATLRDLTRRWQRGLAREERVSTRG